MKNIKIKLLRASAYLSILFLLFLLYKSNVLIVSLNKWIYTNFSTQTLAAINVAPIIFFVVGSLLVKFLKRFT